MNTADITDAIIHALDHAAFFCFTFNRSKKMKQIEQLEKLEPNSLIITTKDGSKFKVTIERL